MTESNLKQKVVKGTAWALLERLSNQAISFVITLVLARLLTPETYGTVALLSIFLAVAGVLADSGFGIALVQKKDATELEFNSVFYLSLALTSIFYVVLFFAAPAIARFYDTPILVPVMRVVAIQLFFNSINCVQNAELARKMLFHLSFRISIISNLLSGVVGIGLAYAGYGVWALVWSGFAGGLSGVVTRWIFIAWRPRLMFSWAALRPLFSFGWKALATEFVDKLYNNLYGLLIGKFYCKADLAFVNKGRHLPDLLMNTVDGTLARVTLPAFSKLQDDPVAMRNAVKKTLQISLFFVVPTMMGLAVLAKPIVLVLFGEQWLPIVPYVQLSCFGMAIYPFHTINLRPVVCMGRTDILLKLEIIKKTLAFVAMVASLHQSVFCFMFVATIVMGPISLVLNAWPNRKLIGYGLMSQLRDVSPILGIGFSMGAFVFGVAILLGRFVNCGLVGGSLIQIFVCAVIGVILYAWLSWMFKLSPMLEARRILVGIINRRG